MGKSKIPTCSSFQVNVCCLLADLKRRYPHIEDEFIQEIKEDIFLQKQKALKKRRENGYRAKVNVAKIVYNHLKILEEIPDAKQEADELAYQFFLFNDEEPR